MSNYKYYDDPYHCPYCNFPCQADFVDIGVGMVQCGPYHCDNCGASVIGPYDEYRRLTEEEERTGWYAPNTLPGSSANVVNFKIVTAEQAKKVYEDFYPYSATDEGRKWIRENNPYSVKN